MKLLEIEGLVTELASDGQWLRAVNQVSLAVRRGETFCLVGESGSGKSVTALSVMGLLPEGRHRHPAGQIRLYEGGTGVAEGPNFHVARNAPDAENARPEPVEGQSAVVRPSHHERDVHVKEGPGPVDLLGAGAEVLARVRGGRIGMIFQEPMTSLNPVLTIGEQLDEVLQLHQPELSDEAREARILAALDEVRIPDPAKRIREYPHRLSGGQRQRVMIAMALICEPAMLIADEPTTALDVTVQAEILRLMRELQTRRGMGMLFITHDFGVVAQIADTVGVMRRGELVECGPVDEVLRQPRHEYTRSLIAALPERLPRAIRPTSRASAATPLIELRDLKVHFPVRQGFMRRVVDHFKAVDGVSLSVAAGEVLALVGESGCGKTTLGRALLRLIEPTAGSIRLEGQDITALPTRMMRPLRRRMQVVFQDPGSSLNPRLPIVTTLVEPMRVHGIGRDDVERRARATALLEKVEMPTDSLWRYPHEFSGGQRQRLAIARALVLEPRFILCDEITSALDVSVQAGILKLLRKLVDDEGLGMLFITHNMGVVEYLADRMAVMHAGRVVESGPTATVLSGPKEDYTRSLLAAVPRLDIGKPARADAP